MTLKIAVVAAEPSGDLLGAALLGALKQQQPDCRFIGIGGPAMQLQGLKSRYPMEKLSVMGLIEVLPHLPELLRIRKELIAWLLEEKPDVFIGIDVDNAGLKVFDFAVVGLMLTLQKQIVDAAVERNREAERKSNEYHHQETAEYQLLQARRAVKQ